MLETNRQLDRCVYCVTIDSVLMTIVSVSLSHLVVQSHIAAMTRVLFLGA